MGSQCGLGMSIRTHREVCFRDDIGQSSSDLESFLFYEVVVSGIVTQHPAQTLPDTTAHT